MSLTSIEGMGLSPAVLKLTFRSVANTRILVAKFATRNDRNDEALTEYVTYKLFNAKYSEKQARCPQPVAIIEDLCVLLTDYSLCISLLELLCKSRYTLRGTTEFDRPFLLSADWLNLFHGLSHRSLGQCQDGITTVMRYSERLSELDGFRLLGGNAKASLEKMIQRCLKNLSHTALTIVDVHGDYGPANIAVSYPDKAILVFDVGLSRRSSPLLDLATFVVAVEVIRHTKLLFRSYNREIALLKKHFFQSAGLDSTESRFLSDFELISTLRYAIIHLEKAMSIKGIARRPVLMYFKHMYVHILSRLERRYCEPLP